MKAISFRGGVPCLHYDLIWMGRRGVKVPRGLGRELGRRGGETRREKTRLRGAYMGGGGRPGGAIRSQRRGRLLELNLWGWELDAFVRSVLSLDWAGEEEKRRSEEENTCGRSLHAVWRGRGRQRRLC